MTMLRLPREWYEKMMGSDKEPDFCEVGLPDEVEEPEEPKLNIRMTVYFGNGFSASSDVNEDTYNIILDRIGIASAGIQKIIDKTTGVEMSFTYRSVLLVTGKKIDD
jgi:hypothetical protein